MENTDVELGFGAVEACLAAVGIDCDSCKYIAVCRGDDDEFRSGV